MNFGWAITHGRFTQTLFLFIVGMWLGRRKLFLNEESHLKFWRIAIFWSVFLFASTQLLLNTVSFADMTPSIGQSLNILITAWRNFAMTTFYVGGITLLYYTTRARHAIDQLSYIGKMSLTDYLLQSAVGTFLFYNWGLALYHTCSHAYSFLLGIAFCICLYFFCRMWSKRFRRGPLEELWARATWINK